MVAMHVCYKGALAKVLKDGPCPFSAFWLHAQLAEPSDWQGGGLLNVFKAKALRPIERKKPPFIMEKRLLWKRAIVAVKRINTFGFMWGLSPGPQSRNRGSYHGTNSEHCQR